jgi:hypothetical protein
MRVLAKPLIFALSAALAACEGQTPVSDLADTGGASGSGGSGGTSAGSGSAGGALDSGNDGPVEQVLLPGYLRNLAAPLDLLEDGEGVPLSWAPQGGYFMFFTGRFGPHDGSDVDVTTELLDPQTGEVVRQDTRRGPTMPVPGMPGMFEPDTDIRAAVSHLPACPTQELIPVFGKTWQMKMRIQGGSFDASAEVNIVPECQGETPGEQAVCECFCSPTYEPGAC